MNDDVEESLSELCKVHLKLVGLGGRSWVHLNLWARENFFRFSYVAQRIRLYNDQILLNAKEKNEKRRKKGFKEERK